MRSCLFAFVSTALCRYVERKVFEEQEADSDSEVLQHADEGNPRFCAHQNKAGNVRLQVPLRRTRRRLSRPAAAGAHLTWKY
jgi:hypothetical protein